MKIIFTFCGLWLLIDILCLLWFAWLHHKGELIADIPDNCKDIF